VLDGFGVLKELMSMEHKGKVIMVSGLTRDGATTTLKALEMGAVDFIEKPSGRSGDLKELSESLHAKIQAISKIEAPQKRNYVEPVTFNPVLKTTIAEAVPHQYIAIGTSTGGPNALKDVFQDNSLPEECAYLIVQHMPKAFTLPFAERLNFVSKIFVKEAEDNEPIVTGHAYLAPGDAHLEIEYRQNRPYIKLTRSGKVSGHQPSIDVLFHSMAKNCGRKTIAVIMTGMGRDGAAGIKAIRDNGGQTIAQDQNSSVVFGMNREAISLGGIEKVVPLKEIPATINTALSTHKSR